MATWICYKLSTEAIFKKTRAYLVLASRPGRGRGTMWPGLDANLVHDNLVTVELLRHSDIEFSS